MAVSGVAVFGDCLVYLTRRAPAPHFRVFRALFGVFRVPETAHAPATDDERHDVRSAGVADWKTAEQGNTERTLTAEVGPSSCDPHTIATPLQGGRPERSDPALFLFLKLLNVIKAQSKASSSQNKTRRSSSAQSRLTAPLAYNPRKISNSLVSYRGRVWSLTDAIKNLPLETRAKGPFSTPAGELNAKMRSKKVTGFFFSSVGNFFESDLGVRPACLKIFFGSGFLWKIFTAPVRDRIRPRYETNESPRHSSGSARHCGLSQSVWMRAHWRAVCV